MVFFRSNVHDLMQKNMNFNDVAIVSIKGNGYRIRLLYMIKDDVINERSGLLQFFSQ